MEGNQNAEDDDFNYHPATGRIDRLEVENFKSYRGHQQIGPFKNFTAIIGPNGSGKSNLMDAISFVLGVRTQQLRGSLKELLYSSSSEQQQAAGHAPRRGYVRLVYETDEGEEVHFSRVIQPSSSDPNATYASVYKINDRVVTWDAYSKRLAGYGILVKVRNFLVFQVRLDYVVLVASSFGGSSGAAAAGFKGLARVRLPVVLLGRLGCCGRMFGYSQHIQHRYKGSGVPASMMPAVVFVRCFSAHCIPDCSCGHATCRETLRRWHHAAQSS
jgi:energy-coupling factor transporter ATP-binding protein EcfA2